jgi:hypothetical protein
VPRPPRRCARSDRCDSARRRPGPREARTAILVHADAERAERLVERAGRVRDDQARVDPPREESTQAHLAHEVLGDGALEQPVELVEHLGLRSHVLRSVAGAPEATERAVGRADAGRVCGRDLGDSREQGPVAGKVAERHGVGERLEVECGLHQAAREEGLHLGGEHPAELRLGPVERLLSEPVAGERERTLAPVPDREGEHPFQAIEARVAPLVPGEERHLRVPGGAERPSGPLELRAHGAVVVDLAVEDDHPRAVRGRDRLAAPRHVDDGEALHPERDVLVDEEPLVVGSAMLERVGHPARARGQLLRIGRPSGDDPRDSAHARRSRTGRPRHAGGSPDIGPAATRLDATPWPRGRFPDGRV